MVTAVYGFGVALGAPLMGLWCGFEKMAAGITDSHLLLNN